MDLNVEVLRSQLVEITEDKGDLDGCSSVECFALEVASQDVQRVLTLSGQTMPLSLYNLDHLKRAKTGATSGKSLILLAPVKDAKAEAHHLAADLHAGPLLTVNVPRSLCTTPDGWDRASALWPFRRPRPSLPSTHPSKLSPESLKTSYHNMQRAIEEAVAAKQRGLPPIGSVVVDSLGETVSCSSSNACWEAYGIPQPPTNGVAGKRRLDSDPYLLSGCDVYTTHEPCTMCSMALLHSRVRSVYYAVPNPSFGGLGSRYRINVQQGLNHRFPVYRGLCEDEVLRLQSCVEEFAAGKLNVGVQPTSPTTLAAAPLPISLKPAATHMAGLNGNAS
eukprot:GGOE01001067.1.p1 GENE.GGOE01001067.1~~GGOE01001067.1.p1  ORF type:complete len:334 (-),score=33.53 GGOE01001067.1:82-1083(-)